MGKDNDAAAARYRAKELWTKTQDVERIDARDNIRHAEDAKTARLKGLRLAKEAAEGHRSPPSTAGRFAAVNRADAHSRRQRRWH
jgi:hypothetical protein